MTRGSKAISKCFWDCLSGIMSNSAPFRSNAGPGRAAARRCQCWGPQRPCASAGRQWSSCSNTCDWGEGQRKRKVGAPWSGTRHSANIRTRSPRVQKKRAPRPVHAPVTLTHSDGERGVALRVGLVQLTQHLRCVAIPPVAAQNGQKRGTLEKSRDDTYPRKRPGHTQQPNSTRHDTTRHDTTRHDTTQLPTKRLGGGKQAL